jgi:hypothetical protein
MNVLRVPATCTYYSLVNGTHLGLLGELPPNRLRTSSREAPVVGAFAEPALTVAT